MKIIWSPLSLERVTEAAEFISRDKPKAARQWVIALFKKVKRLEQFPASGRQIPEISRHDIRELFYTPYRIIYRLQDDRITILTLRHSKQPQYPSPELRRLAELGGTQPRSRAPRRRRPVL